MANSNLPSGWRQGQGKICYCITFQYLCLKAMPEGRMQNYENKYRWYSKYCGPSQDITQGKQPEEKISNVRCRICSEDEGSQQIRNLHSNNSEQDWTSSKNCIITFTELSLRIRSCFLYKQCHSLFHYSAVFSHCRLKLGIHITSSNANLSLKMT